jgi:hypothetical protein
VPELCRKEQDDPIQLRYQANKLVIVFA